MKLGRNSYTLDLTNQVFGRLTVLRKAHKNAQGVVFWFCRCQCGTHKIVAATALCRGMSKSCGCLKKELFSLRITTHGGCKKDNYHPLYKTWVHMISRCHKENDPSYKNYGGRGIKVCERWRGENGFFNFINDIGQRPSLNHSIDRINNNGDYESSNCRWATKLEQNNNRRDNVILEFQGEKQTVTQWAIKLGLPRRILMQRHYNKWSIEKILTTPISTKHQYKK